MAQQNADTANLSGLEGQLRNMILGNVNVAGAQDHQSAQPSRGRGRGRGRGVYRGSDNPHFNCAEQAQGWRPKAPSNTAPTRGREFPPNPYKQGHRGNQHSSGNSQHGPGQPRNQPMQPNNTAQHHPRPQGAYAPRQYNNNPPRENPTAQVEHLDAVAAQEIPKAEMSISELEEKEAFRKQLEGVMRQAFAKNYSGDIATISLVGFGSLASGFAMPGSDMDLAVVPGWKDPSKLNEVGIDRDIPRLLERAVLDATMGGRLLTRTRVPILKVCQSPTTTLFTALFEERQKWDELSEEEQYPTDLPVKQKPQPKPSVETESRQPVERTDDVDNFPELGTGPTTKGAKKASAKSVQTKTDPTTSIAKLEEPVKNEANKQDNKGHHPRADKQWVREKVQGPLDFPKTGCGIQCDINFENPLGIHNSQMLRCYSLADPRVRPIVLFVKSWAKRRKVNSAYSGTLSSYGWVLMVLHYLVNVAQPPVCPNLQHSVPQPTDAAALESFFKETTINGYNVRFWRNEAEIIKAAQAGHLSQNTQSVGALLRGFFQYYASISPGYNYGPRPPQFYWTTEVLSLRTPGGIQTKQNKGWVSATTKITAEKKVTNRYLFAIEDPFETDHNVARTVTHRGIVAIRDEFRRAWRILRSVGLGMEREGGLFDEVVENVAPPAASAEGPKRMTMEGLGVGSGQQTAL